MTVYPGGPQDGITYTITAPDGTVAVFNDPTDSNYVGMLRWSGFDGTDIREAIDERAGADGEVQGLNFRAARTLVGNVEILGTSTTDRNTKFSRMRRAVNALRADGTITFTPDGGLASQVKFRQNQPTRREDAPGWLSKVQFGLKCANPDIVGQSLRTSTVSASPWQATITNQGDGFATPTIAVTSTSGSSTIVLTNVTTGKSVTLLNFDPSAYTLSYSSQFGAVGTGNGQFSGVGGLAVDSSGNVFAVDSGNNRVQKFNGTTGAYMSQFGSAGTGNGQFSGPRGIAIDSTGNIFVVDSGNNRVQKFNSSGTYQSQWGTYGTGNGQFKTPYDIGIDSANAMFVTDMVNQRVQKFDTAGAYVSQFGTSGTGNGQFQYPYAIALDSSNNMFVVDWANNRVQKFNSGGTYQSQFGTSGSGNGQMYFPSGIEIDGSSNIYVTDSVAARVQKFNSSGTYVSQIGSTGTGNGQFNNPQALARNAASTHLYVADSGNNRVQDFLAGSTAVVTLDFSTASVTSGGSNVYQYVSVPTSTWWTLQPDSNLIQVTGGTAWTITWRDTWL